MENRITRINAIFHPESIALYGATDTKGKWGNIIFENIIRGGWKGRLYPINPSKDMICGLKAYRSVEDIKDNIDLAIFTIPAKFLPETIDKCIAKNVKAGVIISAGFKETGEEGAKLEKIVMEKAEQAGMVLAGPNGQGICCTNDSLYPWFPGFYPRKGTIGLVSQSGNIMSLSIDSVVESGVGISKGVSSGNEGDLQSVDYFDYFADDPQVDVIMAYLEGISDGRDFFERTKKICRKKPMIILKGGRSADGAKAAGSHTGSMAGDDKLISAAFKQAGIIRARTIKEAGSLAASFVNRPLPRGKRVGIFTGGGGVGVLATDAIKDEGLEMAAFSEETLSKLSEHLPSWWVPGNPIDTVAGMNPTIFKSIIEILMSCNEMDSLLIIMMGSPRTRKGVEIPETSYTNEMAEQVLRIMVGQWKDLSGEFYDMSLKYNVPVYPIIEFPELEDTDMTSEQGDKPISFYKNVESACRAIGAMTRYGEFLKNIT